MLSSWNLFVRSLHEMFGDRNIALVAQRKIEKLKMEDNHHAQKYIIDFAQWAPLTGYNEIALAKRFYDGLPDRLKDHICQIGRPQEFVALRGLAQDLDGRYWERQDDSVASRSGGSTRANPPKTKDGKTDSTQTSGNSKLPAKADPKPKTNLPLNSAGRLNDDERRRRMDNKLCLYCASPDHIRVNCPTAPPARNLPKPASESSKTTTTTTQSTASNSRVGRVVLTVPPEGSATIETIEESTEESSENP